MWVEAKDYRTGELLGILVEGGTVRAIGPSPGVADVRADWVAPPFFDVQVNGCLGHSFNTTDLTIESIHVIVEECLKHGMGGMCPTLVTNSLDALRHGFDTLRRACESDRHISKRLPLFHLEGPFLSAEDGPRGAHPREHVRRPDWDAFLRLQEAAGGRIGMVTLSPEYDESLPFIEKLREANVVPAIGHTAATPERIREAVKAGARVSTHLGNGSHAVLPRHENYIWEQLAADELWASVIPDGHHLPASVVKSIVRVKTPARTVITCDASPLAGMPPGRHALWGTEFEVSATGRVGVPGTPFLAGSGVFTDTCVGKAVELAGVSLADAVEMATARPRELMGLPPAPIDVGAGVELMLFDWSPGSPLEVVRLVGGSD